MDLAPWWDPTWEIWAHATCYAYCKRVDRYFDLHPWKWISEKPMPGYMRWLSTLQTPVYMQERRKEVPASIRYPRERMLAEYPRYFTSHAAWMTALALSEGVTHLGFYGIHYHLDEEHRKQRAGCEFWMGVAVGKGVHIVNPPGSPLIREPGWLYGYESHTNKRHVREATGGKHPSMALPPQNRTLTVMPNPTVDAMIAAGRDDLDFKTQHPADRLDAQLRGLAPLLPDGRPAW